MSEMRKMFWFSKHFDLYGHIGGCRRALGVIANLHALSGVRITNSGLSDFNFAIFHRVNKTRKNGSKLLLTLMKRF